MGRMIETCRTAIKGLPFHRAHQVPQDTSDPFTHLGSAVLLTKSSREGTIDDGEKVGAYRLMYRT